MQPLPLLSYTRGDDDHDDDDDKEKMVRCQLTSIRSGKSAVWYTVSWLSQSRGLFGPFVTCCDL
jgi:hypothetical protein